MGSLRRCAPAVAALALAMIAGTVTPARAADPVRTILVEGRGYGHGIGMGQWGAYGRAKDGARWQQIVRHYYRGASIERVPERRLRILVRTKPTITVRSAEQIVIRRGDGRSVRSSRARVTRDGAVLILRVWRDGAWRPAMKTRDRFAMSSGALLWLDEGTRERAYRGTMHARKYGGAVAAINVVGMEHYLRAVVPHEMPASWPQHALRAQAVAARSYATRVRQIGRATGRSYDICATTACQVYTGTATRSAPGATPTRLEHPDATRAITATAGRILFAAGDPVLAMYSSSTGGHTATGHAPALRAVPDAADRASPHHAWNTQIPASAVRATWPALGRITGATVIERDGDGDGGGRALRVRLTGARGSMIVSASTFRSKMGLRSTWFRLRVSDEPFRFTFDMGYGTSDPAVRALQDRLHREGFYPDDAPRSFTYGRITRASVRRYQDAHGIDATGYLGPITRRELNEG